MPVLRNRVQLNRSITSYAKFRQWYSNGIRGNPLQLKKSLEQTQLLNVGCGPNAIAEFVNLDYNWLEGVDLVWDITRGIPFKAERFSGIYSEHCLEHLSYEQVNSILSDFFRLLKPLGMIRIVVPDAELYLEIYRKQKNGEHVTFPYGQTAHEIHAPIITSMMVVNSIFRGHGHQYAYDYETLKVMLEAQGFCDIQRTSFREGRQTPLLVDSQSRACESLYIEAMKP
jgi:predicted SAM-dependent methyltransferase